MVILVGQKVVKYQLLQMVQPNINASVLGDNLEQYLMLPICIYYIYQIANAILDNPQIFTLTTGKS